MKRFGPGALTVVTWVIAILFVFPLLWMILTAFDQFAGVLERGFLPYLGNSAFVTVVSTLFVLLLGIPAAYALSLAPVKGTSNALGFLDRFVLGAQKEGMLRLDVATGDIAILFATLLRQMPGKAEEVAKMATTRCIGIMVDGLRVGQNTPLPGRALTSSDLDLND